MDKIQNDDKQIAGIDKEELYLNIINSLHEGIYFVDMNRTISFWNRGAQEITGFSKEEIVGKKCQHCVLNHIDEEGTPMCIVGCSLFKTLEDGEERQYRVFVRHKEGYFLPIHVNVFPVKKDGRIVGALEVFNQDSPKVYEDSLVKRLSEIAMHDALTRLPNRRYLENVLKYKMVDYKRSGHLFAVLFADVDDFSRFNNEYGHDMGDEVLKKIALEVGKIVRTNDAFGRWGGEEYVGIYSLSNPSDLAIIGEKIRHLVESVKVTRGNEELNVSVSVGITAVQSGDTIESIVKRADALMYQSKKEGKNRVSVG